MSATVLPSLFAGVGRFMSRRKTAEPRLPWLAMLPRDIGLFLQSARTDAKIARAKRRHGTTAAFETAYRESEDPWASASPRYRYQGLKYDRLIALLPRKRFANALDLGCGLGLLSQKLTDRAEHVLGIDIAPAAIERLPSTKASATPAHMTPQFMVWNTSHACSSARSTAAPPAPS